jgi:hypothetical protein
VFPLRLVLLRQPEINQKYLISFFDPDEKILGFNVPVNQIMGVDELHPLQTLKRYFQNRF